MSENREWRSGIKELRVDNSSGDPVIVGYAAVFDQLSLDLGGFRERIIRGAFTESILRDDIKALWNHNSDLVMGRNKAGTLILTEDDHGLRVQITPPDTEQARGWMESIDRGDVDQMSFMFTAQADKWLTEEGENIRELHSARLFEISAGVPFPAYPQTDAAIRSLLPEGEDVADLISGLICKRDGSAVDSGIEDPEDPSDDDHTQESEPAQESRLDHRRRELDLLEIEI